MDLSDYECVWQRVRNAEAYKTGYCMNERGFQALLYKELSSKFSGKSKHKNVVVEPLWYQCGKLKYRPDLVMIDSDKISDIFEIKFAPWYNRVEHENDEKKLLEYREKKKWDYYVRTEYRHSKDYTLKLSGKCNLHLVRVAKQGCAAVEPKNISDKIFLWYGSIHKDPKDDCWGISKGKREG